MRVIFGNLWRAQNLNLFEIEQKFVTFSGLVMDKDNLNAEIAFVFIPLVFTKKINREFTRFMEDLPFLYFGQVFHVL
jgi:hypothetical protein